MHRSIIAALAATFFWLYNIFIKVSSWNINHIVWAVILQLVAALVGLLILWVMKFNNTTLEVTAIWIKYAILAGICIWLAEITSFLLFSKWISSSVWVPFIVWWSVVIAAIIWFFFLKEQISYIQILWLVLVVWWIILLSK